MFRFKDKINNKINKSITKKAENFLDKAKAAITESFLRGYVSNSIEENLYQVLYVAYQAAFPRSALNRSDDGAYLIRKALKDAISKEKENLTNSVMNVMLPLMSLHYQKESQVKSESSGSQSEPSGQKTDTTKDSMDDVVRNKDGGANSGKKDEPSAEKKNPDVDKTEESPSENTNEDLFGSVPEA